MTPTGHADLGGQNQLETNQGPKVLESSLARGPLQCQSAHYNNSFYELDKPSALDNMERVGSLSAGWLRLNRLWQPHGHLQLEASNFTRDQP
jgi:hypothetical protein